MTQGGATRLPPWPALVRATLDGDEAPSSASSVAPGAALRAGMTSLFAAGSPGPTDPGLQGVLRDAAFRRVRAAADLRAITDLLSGAGLRWLTFKGPVLDQVVYHRAGLRDYVDLDVLVHPGDVEAALDLLVASGATLVDRNWALIRAKRQAEITLLLRHGSVLDLHWHLVSSPATRDALRIDLEAVFADVENVNIGGRPVPTLGRLDTVWYIAMHGVLSGGHRLSWLADLDQAIRWAEPDPAALRTRAAHHGTLLALQVQLDRLVSSLAPDLRPWRRAIGRRGAWRTVCRIVTRRVGLDPGPDAGSGRLVLSATRRGTATSVLSLGRAVRAFRRFGPDRRTRAVNMSELHAEGGTTGDRAAWLADARAEVRSPNRPR